MLTNFQSFLLILLIVAASLAFLVLVHRFWPAEQRRQHNDLIGWQITVLGTTYAVVIGFMLYAVWTNFGVASSNSESEANSLVSVVRAAQGLPDLSRKEIQKLAEDYVGIMLEKEWPAMLEVKTSLLSARCFEKLWAAVTKAQTRNASEETSRSQALAELSAMSDHRRLRQLEVYSDLPGILWALLIAGAVVTLISASLFGSADFKLHFIHVAALSLLLALVLVAITDINGPFQGSVHVSPIAFERARITLQPLRDDVQP